MSEFKTVVPGQLVVGGQPRPDQITRFALQGYKTLINNRPDGEASGQPGAAEMESEAQRQGMEYVHIPVTLDSISRDHVEAMHEALKTMPAPAIAHCGSGRRSFLLWAAGQVILEGVPLDEMLEKGQSIGVDASVLPELVQRLNENR